MSTKAKTAWVPPPANANDLVSWFHMMRERARIQEQPQRGEWHVFGYAEAKAVLDNHAAFSNAVSLALIPADSPLMLFRVGNLSWMDPPRHLRLRGLVRSVFTPSYVASLTPMVQGIVQEVLNRAAIKDEVAFVEEIATPIVSNVAANMVGIPAGADQQFGRWAAALMALTDPSRAQNGLESFFTETQKMHSYLHEYITKRRAQPEDDLTSRLTQVEIDGARLSDDEIAGLIALLMNTGVTSNQLLINALICLDEQRAVTADLRRNPDQIDSFIEEALRYRGQTPRVERFSMEDVTVSEYQIPAGKHVSVWLSAANRDPHQFPNPDVFDISRSPNLHLGFGHGIHYCLGAALGRIQTAITLQRLLAMTEDIVVDYERSRLLDPRMIVGAAELTLRIRWSTVA